MRRPATALLALPLLIATGFAVAPPASADHRGAAWRESVVDADQSFRGLDAVDRRTAWVAGGSATDGGPGRVFLTHDGGRTWRDVSPPETGGLLFRDVEAQGRHGAVVLAIGPGDASRIYRTTDDGATWTEAFRNPDPAAFYDCLDFYADGRHGLALSDPVDGKFRILATSDGGRSWAVQPNDAMPEAPTEYGFAASGDCLVIAGSSAYFGSGGGAARVFRSDDFGLSWTATDSGIPAGEAAGVFGFAFAGAWGHERGGEHGRDRAGLTGLAVGGDFGDAADGVDAASTSTDGVTWTGGGDLTHLAEDAAFVGRRLVIAVGESGDVAGTSLSRDGGRTWTSLSATGFHTLDCTRDGACWAAGGGGRVGRLAADD